MDKEDKVLDVKEDVKQDLIVEKDGEIYVKADEESDVEEKEKPDTELEEVKPEKDKLEVSEEEDADEDIDPAYKDKSVDDIIQMHQQASKKINEQGEELGKLRKQTEQKELTSEQLRESLSAGEVQVGLKQERVKLTRIDPILDPEEYTAQQEVVTQLETDWLEKRQDELIKEKFNSKENTEFKESQKQRFKDSGVEMSDDEFSEVAGMAEGYLEDGKFTERSFQKGMIDKFGVEKMTKFYQMSGEKKARDDIQKAEGKTTVKVDVKGSGKNAKLVKLRDLSPRELNKTLDGMNPDELKELYSRVNA